MSAKPSGRPPSISDVARIARVSVTTVSRVLNEPDAVTEQRREAVYWAMRQLNYRPSNAARALVTGRSTTIAIVVTDTTKYGYISAIQGVEESARKHGFATIISVIDQDDAEHMRAAVDLIMGQSVAGVVGLEFDRTVGRVVRELPVTVPVAVVSVSGTDASERPSIRLDDALGVLRATSYLLKLGHAGVCYVGLARTEFPDTGRQSGWRNGLEAAGLVVPPMIEADWDPEDAYRAVKEGMPPGVTALLCHNDEMAMGAMSALADLGLRVPEDVSVVGVDDHPLGRVWHPRLTTVSIDFVELGRKAFDLLHLLIRGEDVPTRATLVEPGFVARQSTAAPR